MAGIYCILNLGNSRAYIGKATDPNARLAHHRCVLRKGRHHNPELQQDWLAQSEADFKFIIVARDVKDEDLDKTESAYIARLKKLGVLAMYNKQFPKHHKKKRK